MVRPKRLYSITQLDLLEGPLKWMGACEGGMPSGMPILRENNMFKPRRDAVNDLDHSIAIGHGQRAARTEIVLDVDDEECVVGSDFHRISWLLLSQMNPTLANLG
jgi:hypothetical protein